MASVFLDSKAWVERAKYAFTVLDINKNGFLSVEDHLLHVDNIQKEANPAQCVMDKLRAVLMESCAAVGIIEGVKLTLDQFVTNHAEFAAREQEMHRKGEQLLFFKVHNAWFDVLDTSHDGYVTVDEYGKLLKAWNISNPVESANMVFKGIDEIIMGKLRGRC